MEKERRRIGYELYQFVIAESLKMENMILKDTGNDSSYTLRNRFPTILPTNISFGIDANLFSQSYLSIHLREGYDFFWILLC